MAYLAHHGVKGMHWGVRRTPEQLGHKPFNGKIQYDDDYSDALFYSGLNKNPYIKQQSNGTVVLSKKGEDAIDKLLKDNGVKLDGRFSNDALGRRSGVFIKNGEDYILRSGISMHRVTMSKKETMDGPKYVSVTETDRDKFRKNAVNNQLNSEDKGNVYEMTLEPNKSLKIANGRKIADDIFERYGDSEAKEVWRQYKKYEPARNNSKFYSLSDTTPIGDAAYNALVGAGEAPGIMQGAQNFLGKVMQKKYGIQDSIVNEYAKKGYHAIEDPEDANVYTYDSALILANPSRDTRVSSVKKVGKAKGTR